MDVGKRITELREKKGITTNKLAYLAGISQSYLRDIELGKKNPTVEILSYICGALDISLQDFFTENASIIISNELLNILSSLTTAEQEKLTALIKEMKRNN